MAIVFNNLSGGGGGKLYRYDVTLCADSQDTVIIYTQFYSSNPNLSEKDIFMYYNNLDSPTVCSIRIYAMEEHDFVGYFSMAYNSTYDNVKSFSVLGNGYSPSEGDYLPQLLTASYRQSENSGEIDIVIGYITGNQYSVRDESQVGLYIDEVFVTEV